MSCDTVSARQREMDSAVYIPPGGVEDQPIDRLPEGRGVKKGEEDEACADEREAGGDAFGNLEVVKLFSP